MQGAGKSNRAGFRRLVLAALAVLVLIIGLSACGGDNGSEQTDTQANAQDATAEFAQCMRENGVDIPDPQPGQSMLNLGASQAGNIDPNDPTVQAARDKCIPLLRNAIPEGDQPDLSEIQDATLRFARCMRDHGIDFPDPQVSESGGVAQLAAPEGVDTNSPAFKEASDACQSELPSVGGGTSTEP